MVVLNSSHAVNDLENYVYESYAPTDNVSELTAELMMKVGIRHYLIG